MAIPDRQPTRRRSVCLTALCADCSTSKAKGLSLDTLSMGMSADLESRDPRGATMVRVSSAIFGASVKPQIGSSAVFFSPSPHGASRTPSAQTPSHQLAVASCRHAGLDQVVEAARDEVALEDLGPHLHRGLEGVHHVGRGAVEHDLDEDHHPGPELVGLSRPRNPGCSRRVRRLTRSSTAVGDKLPLSQLQVGDAPVFLQNAQDSGVDLVERMRSGIFVGGHVAEVLAVEGGAIGD
jgi:hypothetical protein